MKGCSSICPACGAEVSGHGATVRGGDKWRKHAALLLLVGEELSISGSATQWDDGRRRDNPFKAKGIKVILLDMKTVWVKRQRAGCRGIRCAHTRPDQRCCSRMLFSGPSSLSGCRATHVLRLQLLGEVAFYGTQVKTDYYRGKRGLVCVFEKVCACMKIEQHAEGNWKIVCCHACSRTQTHTLAHVL